MLLEVLHSGLMAGFQDIEVTGEQEGDSGVTRSVLGEGVACSEPTDRLALMIGSRRAQVMRALVMPRTTTSVAPQHLSVLTEARVVWRQRLGGQVFYQLDREGFMLLENLGQYQDR
ncbi:hypothetical protein [Streptomyces sp. NPDC001155]